MKSVNRKTGLISDYEPSNSVKFLYENAFGRLLLKLMNNHVFSKLVGSYMNSSLSKGRVKKTAAEYHIKLDQEYHSYNEFFTRRMDYNIDADKNSFISPCESKLLAFKLDGEGKFNIKESLYTAREIINDDIIDEYQGGYCLIFRLEVNNYHHYLFVDNGTKEADHFIKGKLHTVQPIAYKRYKVFHENSRMWTILHTENFGDIIDCEVGAICIGKIVNEKVDNFKKGDEKGHFEFGGSTIILFVKKDQVIIDQDILDHSKNLMETEVSIGEKIGIKK